MVNKRAGKLIRGLRSTFADQGSSSIKANFRENFNSRRFDSGNIFKIITFTRRPRTPYTVMVVSGRILN